MNRTLSSTIQLAHSEHIVSVRDAVLLFFISIDSSISKGGTETAVGSVSLSFVLLVWKWGISSAENMKSQNKVTIASKVSWRITTCVDMS
jgi:hypothetical protein